MENHSFLKVILTGARFFSMYAGAIATVKDMKREDVSVFVYSESDDKKKFFETQDKRFQTTHILDELHFGEAYSLLFSGLLDTEGYFLFQDPADFLDPEKIDDLLKFLRNTTSDLVLMGHLSSFSGSEVPQPITASISDAASLASSILENRFSFDHRHVLYKASFLKKVLEFLPKTRTLLDQTLSVASIQLNPSISIYSGFPYVWKNVPVRNSRNAYDILADFIHLSFLGLSKDSDAVLTKYVEERKSHFPSNDLLKFHRTNVVHFLNCLYTDQTHEFPVELYLSWIRTLKRNKNKDREVLVHLVQHGLQKNQIDLLLKEQTDTFTFDIQEIPDYVRSLISRQKTNKSAINQWTEAMFYRLFAPALFPNLDRIIYTDLDAFVLQDPGSLYDQDLQGKSIGIVREPTTRPMYNSGVILMDLKKLRSIGFSEKCTGLLLSETSLDLPDQVILMEVLEDDIFELSPRFNYMPSFWLDSVRYGYQKVNAYYGNLYNNIYESMLDCVICHMFQYNAKKLLEDGDIHVGEKDSLYLLSRIEKA